MIQVIKISPEQCHYIRNVVLWPHKDPENCQIDIDHSIGAFHLGAFINGDLVSIGSFFKQSNHHFSELNQYRLRAMATLPKAQNKGFAKTLLFAAFELLSKDEQSILWCDARLIAKLFYEKMGFKSLGDSYEIPIIGPHYLMYKKL